MTGRSVASGNRLEMGNQSLLAGPRVIGGDRQEAVDPGFGGPPRQVDRLGGVIGPGPGDHPHIAAGDRLDDGPIDGNLLVGSESRRLSGGTGHDETVGAMIGEVSGPVRQTFS